MTVPRWTCGWWTILAVWGCLLSVLVKAEQCPHPAVPLYAKVVLSSMARVPSTTATYTCDDGYELFGGSVRTCSQDGRWTPSNLPYCAVNVAYGKPTNQSSTVKGGDAKNANDGDATTLHENKYCTETKVENSPWWHVDLLRTYEIRAVRLVTRGCCGHQPLHDLEIRVGNSSTVQGNRLCAWFPGTLDDGITKDLECAHPIIGRYVFIQMVGIEGSLSLCEVYVFTTQEFSSDRCGSQLEYQTLTSFNRTCYEFQTQQGGSFQNAQDYCRARGGLVVHGVFNITYHFLYSELERLKDRLKSKLVWLGAKRDPGLKTRTWHWVNGQLVTDFLWAEDQPNNYNGQQNCVVLDGGRKWKWNDVTCDLDYLPWICQYRPSNCGSPDRATNSTVVESDFRVGKSITYQCPVGNMIIGNNTRTCNSNGFWDGQAPTCKYVDCGSLSDIEDGRVLLVDRRTTFNATAKYICNTNYTLVGNDTRICLSNGTWNGTQPKCLFGWCPELEIPHNATLEVTDQKAGGQAKYKCSRGHKLIGDAIRKCQLGGKWSGKEPKCHYIDCGIPAMVANGGYQLLNLTTTYQSVVSYRCFQNYTLIGNKERECDDTSRWSGEEPECKLIDCGEPEIPPGAYLLNEDFVVHSVVEYACENGHLMSGNNTRTCQVDGKWSGQAPACTYVDCGRVQPILKGEVMYLNGTTYLDSIIQYGCSAGYRLVGVKTRQCGEDGRWSGAAPKCEEIRCVPPEITKNSSVVYSGNDRSSADSFKIGSTVQYRCAQGHLVRGQSLRTCDPNGLWTGNPPVCVYTDCGFPQPIPNGRWLLTNNTTYYGSSVEYECDENYRLEGPGRRLCLENATWSNVEPVCEVVTCGPPDVKDDRTIVEGTIYTVGGVVTYSCYHGYELLGNTTRMCLSTGRWSGEPARCQLIDCDRPTLIANGRGFLVNGTTTYGSIVEYHCLPDFRMVGEPLRSCLATGRWSGEEPRCVEMPDPSLDDNSINGPDGQTGTDPNYDSSKTVGIAIAIGAGALLLLVIIIAVVCMKTKKAKPVKNTENVEPNKPEEKETATVMSYSRLSIESDPGVNNNNNNNGAIRHNPNGLVTFSGGNPSQPIYANVTVNGQSIATPVMATSQGVRPITAQTSHPL